MNFIYFVLFLSIAILFLLVKGIKIIKEGEVGIVERLGKYNSTMQPGLIIINPLVDKVRIISVKEITMDIPPQNIMTKDNIGIAIDATVSYMIEEPVKAVYAVSDLRRSVLYMVQTIMRNIVTNMDLKEVLSSRNIINTKLREASDYSAEQWGIKINNLAIKDMIPPRNIQEALQNEFIFENKDNKKDSTNDTEEILKRARDASKSE